MVATQLGMIYKFQDQFVKFVGYDFNKCLEAIETLIDGFIKLGDERTEFRNPTVVGIFRRIDATVRTLLSISEHDLEIKWEAGHFFPSGAKLLDERLVNENLKWLEEQELKQIYDPFDKALLHYSESIKRPEKLKDVITDMYEALEATAQWFLDNGKDLSGNRQSFISRLELPKPYDKMMKEYIDYANKFARHPENQNNPPYKIPQSEAENFIYLTGLFIRFAIQRRKKQA